MGNYVPELFQLQKETVLHARGVYGKPDSVITELPQLITAEFLKLSKKDSLELLKIWHALVKAIKTNDTSFIKNIALDSIVCSACEGMPRAEYENNLESIDMFIDSANINLQRSGLWPIIKKNKYKIEVDKYPENKTTSITKKESENSITYGISFQNELISEKSTYWIDHSFEFIRIENRFRFYSMHSSWSSMRDNKR